MISSMRTKPGPILPISVMRFSRYVADVAYPGICARATRLGRRLLGGSKILNVLNPVAPKNL